MAIQRHTDQIESQKQFIYIVNTPFQQYNQEKNQLTGLLVKEDEYTLFLSVNKTRDDSQTWVKEDQTAEVLSGDPNSSYKHH